MQKVGLLGKQYIVDHIVYMINKRNEDEYFRIYIADLFYYFSRGQLLQCKYSDITQKGSQKTGDEIAHDFLNKLFGEEEQL